MKFFLASVLCFFVAFQLSSQNSVELFPGWYVKHIGASFGQDQDMLHDLNAGYILNTADGAALKFSDTNFNSSDLTSMTCENPHVRLEMALLPPFMKNAELRVGLVGIFNRIDAVNYYSQGEGQSFENLHIESLSNELALETSLLKYGKLGKSVTVYGGVGTNVGYMFDGSVFINTHGYNDPNDDGSDVGGQDEPFPFFESENYYYESEEYRMRNGISQRLFGHVGIGVRFLKRIELGWMAKYGVGYRVVFGADVQGSTLRSSALTLKWLLK